MWKNKVGEMDQTTVIKVDNISKSYQLDKNSPVIPVLKGVSAEIKNNDFAIIYGPSGSGKSTLLHHMVGLELPTSGKIYVNNQDLTVLDNEERALFRAKNFGMVYQLWYWVKSLLVWENVALPLFIKGLSREEAKIKAMQSLDEIGMTDYAYKKPAQLSGGEQQRVGLARALVNDPEIIVADEPTGNLDTASADKVMQFIQDLNHKKKRTIVMVTHNLIYLPMASRTIAMRDGQVESTDTKNVQEQITQEIKEGILK